MSEFLDGFADALQEIDTDDDLVPSRFTWQGLTDAPCMVSGATRGGKLEEFGFASYVDVVVIIRGSLFGGNYPIRQQTFTANGQLYQIDTVLTPAGSPFIRIAGTSATKGA